MYEQLVPNDHISNNESHVPDTSVSYKPTLIPSLLHEHKTLLSLCRDTLQAAKKGNSELSKRKLSKFNDVFSGHLIKKRYALYIYLNQLFEDDAASKRASKMKSEMYRIGKDLHVLSSLYAHSQKVITSNFINKFENLGQALARQLQYEESQLFPVYQDACLDEA